MVRNAEESNGGEVSQWHSDFGKPRLGVCFKLVTEWSPALSQHTQPPDAFVVMHKNVGAFFLLAPCLILSAQF